MLSQKFDIEVFQECFGAHHHEYPQILVPMGETMELSIGNSDYTVTPQELCLVPPKMDHQCKIGRAHV